MLIFFPTCSYLRFCLTSLLFLNACFRTFQLGVRIACQYLSEYLLFILPCVCRTVLSSWSSISEIKSYHALVNINWFACLLCRSCSLDLSQLGWTNTCLRENLLFCRCFGLNAPEFGTQVSSSLSFVHALANFCYPACNSVGDTVLQNCIL